MFFKYCDLISPPITLFYKKEERHINIISGIISLLTYASLICSFVYYANEYFNKKINTFYFYNTLIDDSGIFPLNSSSMFHYIIIGNHPVDFRSVNIIGIRKYITFYMQDSDISKQEHWIYGYCTEYDSKGYDNYIENKTQFIGGACVKKYWNVTEQRYYLYTDTEHFVYPTLEHGASNPNTKNYGVIIQKCNNNTQGLNNDNSCHDIDAINDYMISSANVALYVIDHTIEVHNFSQPLQTYLYKISNGMLGTIFTSNQLNFDPVLVRSHNGIMFDNYDIENSYIYNQNVKSNIESGETGILCCFYFWMQNRLQLYERTYQKIQDCFANFGGLSKMIFSISGLLNYLVNQYITIYDTIRLTNSHVKKEGQVSHQTHINTSTQSLLKDLYQTVEKDNHLHMNHTKVNQKPSSNTGVILKEKIRSMKDIRQRKFNYTELSIKDFFVYLGFICCRKFSQDAKGIERFDHLRRRILSEEFLFDLYFFVEDYKSSQKAKERNKILDSIK